MRGLKEKLKVISQNLHNDSFMLDYGIRATYKEDLIFLNYDLLSKPNKYNRLCRGTIFDVRGELKVLPFPRFFNQHEVHVDVIDWRHAHVLEKLDGTMLCSWFDDEKGWRLSTKRMVDVLKVRQFDRCGTVDLAEKFKEFFPSYKYWFLKQYYYVFEIVTKDNRIVTYYPEEKHGVYLLTMRQKASLNELNSKNLRDIVRNWNEPRVMLPEYFDLKDSDSILRMFKGKSPDWEGVVIVDNNLHRMKIKKTSYVKLHHIASNISSIRNMIDLVLDGEVSEVLSYFPEMRPKFEEIEKQLNMLKSEIMTVFGMYNHLESQKEFALKVKDLPFSHFLFRLRNGDDLKYQFQQMTGKKLERFITPYTEE